MSQRMQESPFRETEWDQRLGEYHLTLLTFVNIAVVAAVGLLSPNFSLFSPSIPQPLYQMRFLFNISSHLCPIVCHRPSLLFLPRLPSTCSSASLLFNSSAPYVLRDSILAYLIFSLARYSSTTSILLPHYTTRI